MVFPRIQSSLVLRTTLVVLGVALGLGLIANEIVGRIARRNEIVRAHERIRELLRVMEPSASAACFVGDQRLADETARGLLNSPNIAAVEIRGTEGLLAEARRPGRPVLVAAIIHPVASPFAREQVVGSIHVYPDSGEVARSVARYVWIIRGMVLLLTSLVGAVLALTVMRTVVKPIKALSDRLASLDAAHGMRLDAPQGHEGDEIGRLVGNVNKALESVEAKQALEQQVKEAHAQKITSLGSLAGGVAHDYNNMLAGIMAYTDLLLMDETNPKRQKYLQSILVAAKRSGELTAKLLAYGRRGKNRVESIMLGAAIQECLSIIQPSMPLDLKVTTHLEDGLAIDGDPTQLQQVLVNLCINAVEAMPSAGDLTIATRKVSLDQVTASAQRLTAGEFVELKVTDTGQGISPEILAKVFEPFFTTKTKEGRMGTGLGLSTVFGIVEAHHGAIDVVSKIGLGTTFQVLLPLGRLTPDWPAKEGNLGSGKGTILIVEDEPLLRDVAQNALENLGYTVETAVNGRAGVDAYLERHERLLAVLLDLKMPVMGGKEAFELMRSIDPTVPILICTGFGENEEVQELLSQGAAGLLAKPYRIHELSEALQRLRVEVLSS